MNDPKDKKKKTQKPSPDKRGGAEPLTEKEFFKVLDRAINPPKKQPDLEKGKTSE
jgi:hypothetical protein